MDTAVVAEAGDATPLQQRERGLGGRTHETNELAAEPQIHID